MCVCARVCAYARVSDCLQVVFCLSDCFIWEPETRSGGSFFFSLSALVARTTEQTLSTRQMAGHPSFLIILVADLSACGVISPATYLILLAPLYLLRRSGKQRWKKRRTNRFRLEKCPDFTDDNKSVPNVHTV